MDMEGIRGKGKDIRDKGWFDMGYGIWVICKEIRYKIYWVKR